MALGEKGDPSREQFILGFVVSLLIAFSLTACGPAPSSALSPTTTPIPQEWITFQNQSTETIFIETVSIPLENCNGNRPAMSETSRARSTTTTIELGFSGSVEAGIPEVVKVALSAELNVSEGESHTADQNVRVEVDPSTQVTYELTWFETWQVGEVVISNLNLTTPYRVRTGIQSELRSGTPQMCPPTFTLTPFTLIETPTLTPTQAPPDTATVAPTLTQTPTWTTVPTATLIPTLVPPTFTATVEEVIVTPVTPSEPVDGLTYPCDAQIVSRSPSSTILAIVRSYPGRNAPLEPVIQQGSSVIILTKTEADRIDVWYQIADSENEVLGWVLAEYVVPSRFCPE